MNKMNDTKKHYLDKAQEARKILDTIPIPAQMRTKATVITNSKFEPVVVVECDFKRVDINNLHGVIAYDHEKKRWMDAAFIPEDADPERYIVYAPDDWQLTPFLQVRIDTVIDHFNKKDKQPEDSFTAHVFVGEWDTPKYDNLIGISRVLDKWYAVLSLTFEQTEDASKAIFFYDWNTHKYYPMGGGDVSDPLKYTMFAVAESCKHIPAHIDMTGYLYTLNCGGEIMPKITILQYSTEPMSAEEFDAAFPGYREQLENKEDTNNDCN